MKRFPIPCSDVDAAIAQRFATGPVPVSIPTRKPYTPILSQLERKAYQIAHKLLMGEVYDAGVKYGTRGRQRTAQVDAIAKVIMEEMNDDENRPN